MSLQRIAAVATIVGTVVGVVSLYIVLKESDRKPLPATQVDKSKETTVVRVQSDPEGADTYLEWKLKGKTPLELQAKSKGLLVVMKDGHLAGFREIENPGGEQVTFTLPLETKRSSNRLLFVVSNSGSADVFFSLKSQLAKEGFTVLGHEEAEEFQQELSKAGGLSHKGLRAWARARFDTDLLVTAQVRRSSWQLSEQEFGFPGVREAVKGAVKTEIEIDLELINMRSGDHLAAITGTGVGFALDRVQSFQKALAQAVDESAKLLRQKIQG